jgi:hypothetical protein
MGKSKEKAPAAWKNWDEYDVGKWMKKRDLEKYAKTFIENGIRGRNLPDCLQENKLAGT